MFVKGGQISERGDKFPRKYGPREAKFPRKFGRGGQIFGGAKFPVTPDAIWLRDANFGFLLSFNFRPFQFFFKLAI